MSTPKTKHCGEKHCRETAWLYNFLVYSQDKTLRRETLPRDRLVVQFPCLLPRQNIAARNIAARPPGCTISLSTPKTKHCGEKHCRETASLYNFLVYSQDKTLRRETLWRDRLVVQFPCLLPRQNIVARNIVARPPGRTISLSTPKTKHCGEKHCGETAWLYNFLVYSQNKTLWRDRLVGSCRVERGYNFLVYSQNKTLWRDRLVGSCPVERGYNFLVRLIIDYRE